MSVFGIPAAYKLVAVAAMIAEINFCAERLDLPTERPIKTDALRLVHVSNPFVTGFGGTLETEAFSFVFFQSGTLRRISRINRFEEIPLRDLQRKQSQMKSLINTNEAYQLATNWLMAISVDVQALEKNYAHIVEQPFFYPDGRQPPARHPPPPVHPPKSLHGKANHLNEAIMQLNDLCKDAFPTEIYETWRQNDISEALPVQRAAVEAGIFAGRPLLVVAPTSSGKTFLGEMLALGKAVSGSRAIYLVPFKAIAEERFSEFVSRYSDNPKLGFRCIVSDRDHHESDSDLLNGKYDIAILTYEKLAALLVTKPPVPHAGSQMACPGCGATTSTIAAMSGRGVKY